MSIYSVFGSRLRALFARKRLERELDDELQFHLEMQTDENLRAGMDEREARRAANRSFGGRDKVKEAYRSVRALQVVEMTVQDVRHAVRAMRKSPGFTAVVVCSLALGIGANTGIFSVADTLLLRPLPVRQPAEVLTVASTFLPDGGSLVASYPEYVDIRDRSVSFDGLIAITTIGAALASEPDATPAFRVGALVSGNFFSVLGVEPTPGRGFRRDEDEVPGRDAVVVLSHDFWSHQFGADSRVVGRTVWLNGIAFTVIGVAPESFTGLDTLYGRDFYAPLMMWPRLLTADRARPLEVRNFRNLAIKGRLKRGVTIDAARSELAVLGADLERTYPDTNRSRVLRVRTELQNRAADEPGLVSMVLMLGTLAATVLLVACANVAGLLTSRAPVRAREIAMRMAIGAGRRRLVRQMLTESVLMAGAGCLLGIGIAYGDVQMFRAYKLPIDPPIPAPFEVNARGLFVGIVAALVSAAVFGVVPAIRSTRTDLTAVMKATDAGVFGSRRQWGRRLLVVALFIYRGFQQRLANGPGFRTDHLLTMNFDVNLTRYSDAQGGRFYEELLERVRQVPGVRSATLSSFTLMDGGPRFTIVPEGVQFPSGQETATVIGSVVDEGYFDTMGITVLKGRGFLATDGADAPTVAIVNEQVARHYWPVEDPIGKQFRLDGTSGPLVQIVGVAKTSKYAFLLEPPTDFIYLPFRQRLARQMSLAVLSFGDPASLAAPIREVVRRLDAGQPIFYVRTMEDFFRMRVTTQLNLVSGTVAAMGAMGLALSIVGLYGLVAYAVGRRTREIGVRMAIGATRVDVLRMVLGPAMLLAVAGLAVGLLASILAGAVLQAIFNGGPAGDGRTDVIAFPMVAAAVLIVTYVAAYIPARRATRVNPTEALRCE